VKINKKLFVVTTLVIAASVCATAASNKPEPEHYKNLKVLPQNISSKDLQEIMVDDFQDALGVTCNFCHAESKDGHGLDFVSDAKPEKEITRNMMRMSLDINKKYFKLDHPLIGSRTLIVNCNTCHKGTAFPEGAE